MIPIWAAMAAMTAAQMASNAEKERQTKKMRAAEIRYSPWTRLAPSTQVEYANPANTAMQGGVSALTMQQGLDQQQMQNALNEKQLELMQSQADFYNRSSPSQYSNPWDFSSGLNQHPFWGKGTYYGG